MDVLGLMRLRDTDAGARLPSVSVSTPLIAVGQRLAHLTGVRLTTVTRNYDRLGCSAHCEEPHLHVHSTTVRWSLTGERARVFLTAVRPHLHVKGTEVDALLEASTNPRSKPRTLTKMTEIGWPV